MGCVRPGIAFNSSGDFYKPVEAINKECRGCHKVKALEDFHKDSKGHDGRSNLCRKCTNEQDRKRYQRKKDLGPEEYKRVVDQEREERNREAREAAQAVRGETYRSNHGVSLEGYKALLAAQGGVCPTCGAPPGSERAQHRRLAVDHDHSCCPGLVTCGKCLRGLLCSKCNMAVGYAADSPEILQNLARYLIEFNARRNTSTITF